MNDRQKKILNFIEEKTIATVQELILFCDVSEATIRRDLTYLEDKNLIYRGHGCATKKTSTRGLENSINSKKGEYVDDKKKTAYFAAKNFIESGQIIYLDAGTSTFDLIEHLRNKNITVVTNSVYHLEKLIHNKIYTIMLGGIVKHSTLAVVGVNCIEQLSKYSFDICFIGCNGIDHNFGISTADENEAAIKNKVIKNSKKKYILADISKFGHRKFQKFADINDAVILSYTVPEDFKKYPNILEIKKEVK